MYTVLKVVSYYDLSVLSMSVIGFQKQVLIRQMGRLLLDLKKKNCKAPYPTLLVSRSLLTRGLVGCHDDLDSAD